MTETKIRDWKPEKSMKLMAKVMGKERLLLIFNDNTVFLDNPEDVKETGINCGLQLHEWFDSEYLERIRAN